MSEVNNLDSVKEIIRGEDIKNPLSDEEIANRLSILRETVTNIRNELKIPNSRERRKPAVIKAIKSIKDEYPDISSRQLNFKLIKLGFDVSKNYISEILNNYDEYVKLPDDSQKIEIQCHNDEDYFNKLVGYDGSLTRCIKQAKAAILYPPFGLPTLVVGESGTGKTLFAECIYKYAVQQKILKETSPFVSLNCADYGDNPQLLLSILYGYKKGSFTGADKDTPGLVENANNGVLFLDEIHRLPPKGQEILFSLLDKGRFRRLGETSNDRKVNIFFIGATTENIESSLLVSFRRRIPMLISIPPLKDRQAMEKVQLIYNFFQEESNRTNFRIFVNGKIIRAFVMKSCQGNIGQLKSEIQVTCANAYVDKINNGKDTIEIGLNEILYNNFFGEDINSDSEDMSSVDMLFIKDKLFIPQENGSSIIKDTKYSLPEDIYKKIEEKYAELKKLNISPNEMEKVLWTFIVNNFSKIEFDSNSNQNFTSLDNLKYIVDDRIILILKNFIKELRASYPNQSINEKVVIYLAIHISESIKRIRFKSDIINPNAIYIKENFKEEYKLACNLTIKIEEEEKLKIPDDEIGFIAMYIRELLKVKNKKNKIGLIVMGHGRIASEMVKVANELMNVDFPIAIDMPLDTNPAKVFEKAIEYSKILNTGSGVLILVDMGSLTNIGDIINERAGIKTRIIDRVDLLTVLEAVRRIYFAEESLDDIYYELVNSRYKFPMLSANDSKKPPALVAMCLTGEGIAIKIKDMLAEHYKGIKIFILGLISDNIEKKVECLKQKYNLIGIVGTINPGIEGVKFIPFENDFLTKQKIFIDGMLNQKYCISFKDIIRKDFVIFDLNCDKKNEVIEKICLLLFNNEYIKKDYLNSVLEREKMNTTYFKGGIAIPHGMSAYVNKSSVVFVRLKKPIVWDNSGRKVKLICMLAISNNDTNVVSDLFKSLKRTEIVNNLMKAKTHNEFINVLVDNLENE